MADDQRVYSDEEFALVLRTAAELASRRERRDLPSDGLTLAEMKSAAAQAGLDATLVERAARMLATRRSATPFERLIGGPLRHERDVHVPLPLDERNAAGLLSAVRISATHDHGSTDGHASALGVTWSASGGGDVASVVARPDDGGTSLSVVIDRRGTFVLTAVVSSLSVFTGFVAGIGLSDAVPMLAPWIPVAGIAGTFALARGFWASSTRRARERTATFMHAMEQALGRPEQQTPEDNGQAAPDATSVLGPD